MLVSVAAGLLNGVIVQYLGINAFIVTLGTMTALRGVVLIVTDGRTVAVEKSQVINAMRAFETGRWPISTALVVIGILLAAASIWMILKSRRNRRSVAPVSVGLGVCAACLLAVAWSGGREIALPKIVLYMIAFATVVWFVLSFTMVGRRVYAVGGNPRLPGFRALTSCDTNLQRSLCAVRRRGLPGSSLEVVCARSIRQR